MSARIASLHCYPLKSGRGVDVEQTPLTAAGLLNDRSWMIVTPAGRFLTQRELPRLALVRPRLTDTEFVLEAPACEPLTISLYDPCTRVPVVVWGAEGVAKDVGRIRAFVEEGAASVAFAVFIDEGRHFRHRAAHPGSRWVDWDAAAAGGAAPSVLWSRWPAA